jgi:hypothetical protein
MLLKINKDGKSGIYLFIYVVEKERLILTTLEMMPCV